MLAFERAIEQEFLQRAARHLSRYFPDVCEPFGKVDFDAFLRDQKDRARPYGMTTERQLVMWFMIALLAGPNFDEAPDVSEFLRHPSFTPYERMQGLLGVLLRETNRRLPP